MSRPNLNGFRRRLLVTLGALGLLAMLGVCYFYYFNQKEQQLEERNFRILHRIEENFGRRIQDYQKLLLNHIKSCPDCVDVNGRLNLDSLRTKLDLEEVVRVEQEDSLHDVGWEFNQRGQSNLITFYFNNRNVQSRNGEKPYFKISVLAEPILTSVLRYDVFPSYHLGGPGGTAYNNCAEVCDLIRNDSLNRNDHVQILKVGAGRHYIFSHPFSLNGGRGMVLSGILDADRYGQDKFNVPGNFLLGVFLLLLVILLAFPFIKSFLVSPEETLAVPDVLLALLSLFLLCYMSTFIHLSTFALSRDVTVKRQMLQETGDNLSLAFLNELDSMRRQLSAYDSQYVAQFDATGQRKTSGADSVSPPAYYPDYYRVFWLNHDGIQVKEVNKKEQEFFDLAGQSERNYHDREYFKAVRHEELWLPDSAETVKFYLDPVYSRTDGSFRAVLGMKSRDTALVTLMSSKLRSVIEPVLPREMDFCLLNAKGDILFTSTGNQHLQENLPEECNFSPVIVDALYSRERRFVDQSFMGRDCTFCISPMKGLPLYLVTLTYNEYSGNTQLQVCIYTSLFILALLAVFSVVIFMLVFLTRKATNPLIRRPYLDISLLFPSSRFVYRDFGGIMFNFVLMAAVIVAGFISRNEPGTLIALLLLNASGTTAAFCYARLDARPSRRAIFWAITIFSFIIVDILLLNTGAWENPGSFISLILFECLLIAVVLKLRELHVLDKYRDSKDHTNDNGDIKTRSNFLSGVVRMQHRFSRIFEGPFTHELTFYNQYAMMLVTWFCLVTIIPTAFVFHYLYKNEVEFRIRSAQIDMARKIFDYKAYNRDKSAAALNNLSRPDPQTYFNGYFSTRLVPDARKIPTPQKQELLFDKLLSMYRLSWNQRIESRGSAYYGSSDSSIRFGCVNDTLLLSYHNLLNHPNSQNKNQLQLLSIAPEFPIPVFGARNFLSFAIFFLTPFAFLLLLFYVINFFLKRFFLFTILPLERKEDTNFFDRIYEKYQTSSLKLIILGVTASGKRELVLNTVAFIYKKEQENPDRKPDHDSTAMEAHLHFFDLAEMEQSMEELKKVKLNKGDIVVLNHFEHNLAEKETNDQKFTIISTLSRECERIQAHLIILSNIHPSVFLNNQKEKTTTGSFNAEDYINTQDYYNWTGLLSGFEIYVKPYPIKSPASDSLSWEESFELYEDTKTWYVYYLSIWNSLTRIEKFVAYDLATDGLVNYRNKAALYSLYAKGLVVMGDVPELMNDKFRTFILTEISESDVELEKRQSGNRSSWDMFRVPFLIILFAALMFVFLTQQETFNKLMAGLAAIAGSVPLLIKLFTQEKKPA